MLHRMYYNKYTISHKICFAVHCYCFIVLSSKRIRVIYLPIVFRVDLLPLGQSIRVTDCQWHPREQTSVFFLRNLIPRKYLWKCVNADPVVHQCNFRTEKKSDINPSSCRLNTLRPRQNGCHFADDSCKCIFLNENIWISNKNSLKFVPKGPIDNIPALVQIMAWRRPGDKPLSEPMLVKLPTHICVTQP